MALDAKGQKYCKVVHMENGRTTTRRMQTMMVQAADGKLHYILGDRLPDAISLYSGQPYTGAHTAEVLLNPRSAYGIPLFAEPFWLFQKRDAFFLGLGMFILVLIHPLAESAALSLAN